MTLDELDRGLLALLEQDARTSTSALARQLAVSRTTVQQRLRRLLARKVIAGFTVAYHPEFRGRQLVAQVMIQIDPKYTRSVTQSLRRIEEVRACQAISGPYDLVASVEGADTEQIDRALDSIGEIEGVAKTLSSIVLSTKFRR